jgi:hypothetical protein
MSCALNSPIQVIQGCKLKKKITIQQLGLPLRIPFVIVFPGQSQFFGFLRALSHCPTKFGAGCKMAWGFSSHKNMTSKTTHTNILTLPQMGENICRSRTTTN